MSHCCRHCLLTHDEHATDGKCLYHPTVFTAALCRTCRTPMYAVVMSGTKVPIGLWFGCHDTCASREKEML